MNIIVTGASKGIGRALVERFCNQGHTVVGLSRDMERMEALREGLSNSTFIPVAADLTRFDDYPGWMEALDPVGEIHLVVHNAGYLAKRTFKELSEEDFRKSWEVNVMAPVALTKQLLDHSPNAQHIYIGSMAGFQGSLKFPTLSAYGVAKAGVSALAELLAVEFADTKATFNCLCLGGVQTEMFAEAFPGVDAPNTPESIAEFIDHFSRVAPGRVNGKVIPVTASNP